MKLSPRQSDRCRPSILPDVLGHDRAGFSFEGAQGASSLSALSRKVENGAQRAVTGLYQLLWEPLPCDSVLHSSPVAVTASSQPRPHVASKC